MQTLPHQGKSGLCGRWDVWQKHSQENYSNSSLMMQTQNIRGKQMDRPKKTQMNAFTITVEVVNISIRNE
jgi:hypothetical protein